MSDDPETARQIAELARDERPLLVLDVDDVLLQFIGPFPRFLESEGFELRLDSFRLNGNVFNRATGEAVDRAAVSALIDGFFAAQAEWQAMMEGAADALASIQGRAEIVLLTAMPHRHHAARRSHLDRLGLPYPLITTEMAKGPAIKSLRGETARPVAFVDDQPQNLISAREAVPEAGLFHLVAHPQLRALLPPPIEGVAVVESWAEAMPLIARTLAI